MEVPGSHSCDLLAESLTHCTTSGTPVLFFVFCFFVCLFVFKGLHLQHMEIPRLGFESELQLLACSTAIATQDLNHVCDLHHSSWQCWILSPLSEARDWTHILMETSQVYFRWATTGTPSSPIFNTYIQCKVTPPDSYKKITWSLSFTCF